MTVILTGCSSSDSAKIEKYSDLKGKVIGVVSSPASNESLAAILSKYLIGAEPKEVVGYNNVADQIAALLAGEIDAIPASKSEANFYVKRNSEMKIVEAKQKLKTDISMILRTGDRAL